MTMQADTADSNVAWHPCPAAAHFIAELADSYVNRSAVVRKLSDRMLAETGTRLLDWIDHLALPADTSTRQQLKELGFTQFSTHEQGVWRHSGALLPPVVLGADRQRLAVKVESVADYLFANQLAPADVVTTGEPLDRYRAARISSDSQLEFWIVERHGYDGFTSQELNPAEAIAVLRHGEAFRLRQRDFPIADEGFRNAQQLIEAAIAEFGVDRACDLFFAAERHYWQSRNSAARIQKARQDALGLGWANHDHHTYRASREHFRTLIATLELLGFTCRERFYAGREAGWGAQVLEQPVCGITVFADVDLEPEEVAVDFARRELPPKKQLGTVGLWCKLHGEAFLQAGMHHLECQFDFDAARRQLADTQIESMAPFTDFAYLKQCFTEGEIWPVAEQRIAAALSEGYITEQQAEQFRREGARGSHLEILERNDGYKGFNQTGISEIISRTDPRNR